MMHSTVPKGVASGTQGSTETTMGWGSYVPVQCTILLIKAGLVCTTNYNDLRSRYV